MMVCTEACFHHWIKKVIVTFYLTVLTGLLNKKSQILAILIFFLSIASLYLTILTFAFISRNSEKKVRCKLIMQRKSQDCETNVTITFFIFYSVFFSSELDFITHNCEFISHNCKKQSKNCEKKSELRDINNCKK